MDRARGRIGARIVAAADRAEHLTDVLALLIERLAMLFFELRVLRGVIAGPDLCALDRIEEQWRSDELIENEHHGADEQDEKLHRHFHHAVEEKPETALRDGLAGEVALHLRLIGAEI